MSVQLPIDFSARARATDPGNSHRAAARVSGPTIAQRVVDELKANGSGTSHELAERLGLSLVTVSPRMRPLAAKRLVVEEGKRDGRTVWRAL